LLTRQLVRIGNFKGPFTIGMFRNGGFSKNDWIILRAAQSEINTLGEDTLPGNETP
jgi:phage FluMu protein gp41